jgi:hypothetical protein
LGKTSRRAADHRHIGRESEAASSETGEAKIIKAEAEIQANSPSSPLMAKAAGFSCSLDFALLSGTVKFPETLEDA